MTTSLLSRLARCYNNRPLFHRNVICAATAAVAGFSYDYYYEEKKTTTTTTTTTTKPHHPTSTFLSTTTPTCSCSSAAASSTSRNTKEDEDSMPFGLVSEAVPIQPMKTQQPILRMSREPRLKDKVAVITGASRGLGQAIALRFVQEGAKVVLLDIIDAQETLDLIGQIVIPHNITNNNTEEDNDNVTINVSEVALAIPCDISNPEQIQHAIQLATSPKHYGPKIDILVNNACAFIFQSVEDATVDDWNHSMNVNILGHALVTKYCLPFMKHSILTKDNNNDNNSNKFYSRSGYGPSIIFQGSISSFRGQPNCATYATMKGAIVQLARNCAYDLAKYNIRVNTICAGTIETPISQQERKDHGWTFEEWQTLKTQEVCLGRVGTPLEIAHAAVFFASEESSYCSGTYLMVDGGAAACTSMPHSSRPQNT